MALPLPLMLTGRVSVSYQTWDSFLKAFKLDALEITEPSKRDKINRAEDFVFITSSDAHFIHDIGKRYSCFMMKEITFEEIRKCLSRENGRKVLFKMEDISLHILDIAENSIRANAKKINIMIIED